MHPYSRRSFEQGFPTAILTSPTPAAETSPHAPQSCSVTTQRLGGVPLLSVQPALHTVSAPPYHTVGILQQTQGLDVQVQGRLAPRPGLRRALAALADLSSQAQPTVRIVCVCV